MRKEIDPTKPRSHFPESVVAFSRDIAARDSLEEIRGNAYQVILPAFCKPFGTQKDMIQEQLPIHNVCQYYYYQSFFFYLTHPLYMVLRSNITFRQYSRTHTI